MEQKKEIKKRNKNAMRSRRLIIEAYTKLLSTEKADKITVTKIVETADLNRSTFYAHFSCPNDVLETIENDIADKFLKIIAQTKTERVLENPFPLLMEIFKLVQSEYDLYSMLINNNKESTFLKKLRDLMIEKLMSDKETLRLVKDRKTFYINLRFLAGGYVQILHDWFEGSITAPPEEFIKIISETIKVGTQTFTA